MQAEEQSESDRRDGQQREGRQLGWVISCTGSCAVLICPMDGRLPQMSTWSIGNLITISTPESRVVGFVRSVESVNRSWSNEGVNELFATIDLVGEVTDRNGVAYFQRGIHLYPQLGAESHRIRQSDLQAIYRVETGQAVEVGKLSQDDSIAAAIDIESMLKRHFAVVGSTGVGKSTALTYLVRKAVETRPDLRVLMLDPHNEFAAAFPGEANVLDPKSFELPFWMLRFEELVEVIFRGRDPNDNEIDFLREAMETARSLYMSDSRNNSPESLLRRSFRETSGAVSADRPTPFRLTDIYAQIEEEIGRLEVRYPRFDLKTLRNRIKEVADDPTFSFMFGKASVDDSTEQVLNRLFNLTSTSRRITVLQLAGIPAEAVNAVVSVLARLSFDVAIYGGTEIETLMVCEEAHRYIPNDPRLGFAPTRRSIARIAKEGRKYGAYLAIVTQRPGELDPTILSQCSTVFAMRLTNDIDQDIIRSAISDSSIGILAFLSSIGNREAIAFGEAIATPMRMRFVEIDSAHRPQPQWLEKRFMQPRGVDVRDIVSRMRGEEPAHIPQQIPLVDALPQRDMTSPPAINPQRAYMPPARSMGREALQKAVPQAGEARSTSPEEWPSNFTGFRLR